MWTESRLGAGEWERPVCLEADGKDSLREGEMTQQTTHRTDVCTGEWRGKSKGTQDGREDPSFDTTKY
jgi:hypothetical protein